MTWCHEKHTCSFPLVQALAHTVQSCLDDGGFREAQHLIYRALHPGPQLFHLSPRQRHAEGSANTVNQT